jgi:hypothetical protein
VAWSLLHADTFTGTNGTSLHGRTFSDTIGQWSTPAGGLFEIQSNQAQQTTNTNYEGIIDSVMSATTGDQRAATDCAGANSGVTIRHDNGGVSAEFYLAYFDAGTVTIYLRSGGGFTSIATGGSMSNGDRLMLEVVADRLDAFVNGGSVCNGTDSNLVDGRAGLYGASGTGQQYDNFEVYIDVPNEAIFFGGIGGVVGGRLTA